MAARVQARRAAAKKVHYTKAQNKAMRVYMRRHPPTRAQNIAYRKQLRVQARQHARLPHTQAAKVRQAPLVTAETLSPGVVTVGGWILADNDTQATCVAVAVANSLLAQTGIRVSDDDVRAFHERCAGADGVSIPDALAAAGIYGIGGHRPVAAWSGATEATAQIVGLTDGFNDHAVVVTPAGLISWGGVMDPELSDDWWLDGEFYSVRWREG